MVVHLTKNDISVGDLDNFVPGVLDAPSEGPPEHAMETGAQVPRPEVERVRPDGWAPISDDIEGVEIRARKVVGEVGEGEERYEVELEGG